MGPPSPGRDSALPAVGGTRVPLDPTDSPIFNFNGKLPAGGLGAHPDLNFNFNQIVREDIFKPLQQGAFAR
jgi:hypothetical protein